MTDAPADLVLVLEASTGAASVALLRGDALLGVRAVAMGASRDDAMFPAIQTLLADADVAVHDLDAIVCGAGPGSCGAGRQPCVARRRPIRPGPQPFGACACFATASAAALIASASPR